MFFCLEVCSGGIGVEFLSLPPELLPCLHLLKQRELSLSPLLLPLLFPLLLLGVTPLLLFGLSHSHHLDPVLPPLVELHRLDVVGPVVRLGHVLACVLISGQPLHGDGWLVGYLVNPGFRVQTPSELLLILVFGYR